MKVYSDINLKSIFFTHHKLFVNTKQYIFTVPQMSVYVCRDLCERFQNI